MSKMMERIDDFFRNKQSEEEQRKFFELLEKDAELKKEYELIKNLKTVYKTDSNRKIKSLLKEQELTYGKVVSMDTRTRLKWFMLAASVLFAVVVFKFIGPTSCQNELNNLYVENFTPYPNELVTIERGKVEENHFTEIFSHYNQGNFAKAIQAIDEIEMSGKMEEDLQFYKAISLMSIGEFEDAEKILRQLDHQELDSYENQINWYMALLTLRDGRTEISIDYLDKLSQSNSNFRKSSAQKLLLKINALQN